MSDEPRAAAIEDAANAFQPGYVAASDESVSAAEADVISPTNQKEAARLPSLPQVSPFTLPDLQFAASKSPQRPIDFLRDVELNMNIELGRTELELEEVRRLRSGTVVALDRRSGEPVDVVVNGQLIARGEVIVMDGKLCVRVSEVLTGEAA